MTNPLSIGIIGLDSSRSVAFAELLAQADGDDWLRGTKITSACVWPISRSVHDAERARIHAEKLRRMGVEICDQPEEVARRCDLLLLLSADARDRKSAFDRVVGYDKPVFFEKSLADTSETAQAIMDQAVSAEVRVFSASSLRFSPGWPKARQVFSQMPEPLGMELHGPMPPHETLPAPLWYGIHLADLAVDALGAGWSSMERIELGEGSVTVVRWPDGRFAMLWGHDDRRTRYIAMARGLNTLSTIDLAYEPRECNKNLLSELIRVLAKEKRNDIDAERMMDVVRMTEAMTCL